MIFTDCNEFWGEHIGWHWGRLMGLIQINGLKHWLRICVLFHGGVLSFLKLSPAMTSLRSCGLKTKFFENISLFMGV